MDIESAVPLLGALAQRFPRPGFHWEKRPEFGSGATPKILHDLQQAVGAPLPEDFLDFLRRCDQVQAMGVGNGYWIGGAANITSYAFRSSFPASVLGQAGQAERVLPVATDGGGNAFLLSLGGGPVWHWDHETGAVSIVASSLSHFLQRVIADWEHVLADDQTWQYLV